MQSYSLEKWHEETARIDRLTDGLGMPIIRALGIWSLHLSATALRRGSLAKVTVIERFPTLGFPSRTT